MSSARWTKVSRCAPAAASMDAQPRSVGSELATLATRRRGADATTASSPAASRGPRNWSSSFTSWSRHWRRRPGADASSAPSAAGPA